MAIPPIPSQLTLEIVTPDHAVMHDHADEVVLPAVGGYLGVLPGHTPVLTSLQLGEMWYRRGTEKLFLAIAFGFAEIQPHHVTILAQVAERAEEIDTARAEAAKRRAEDVLSKAPAVPIADLERARVALMKALVRLRVSSKARTRG